MLERYELEIGQILVKAIDTCNLLKDGKVILAFRKLNGTIQKLNLLHARIKELNEKNND